MKVEHSLVSTHDLKNELSSRYNFVEQPEVAYMHQGFHDSYLVVDGLSKYMFWLYRHNWKSLEDIIGEIKLLTLLNDKNISAHYPISDSEGVYAHSIVCPEGIRHYVLFNFAPGKVLTALNPETAESFGVQLGKIHDTTANLDIDELSRSYLPLHLISSTREVLRTRFDPSDNCHNKLNSIADILSEKLTPEIIQQLPVGICHGDPHYENAIFNFEHQKLTFIDFDFCGHGHLLYDLGSFFYYERERPEIQSSFLIGYQSVRTMSAVEISLIPYFQILMQLFHLGARATHADGIKSPLWHDDQIIEKLDTIAKQLKGLKEE